MKRNRWESCLRLTCCVALLAMLGICGMIGAGMEKPETVGVPVSVQLYGREEMSQLNAEEIRRSLLANREAEIALLDSVIGHPSSAKESIAHALEQKTMIARRMEQEAQAEAALLYAGFDRACVLSGLETVSIFAPYTYLADENARVRMIDCVSTQTGIRPEDIKIILAKNE